MTSQCSKEQLLINLGKRIQHLRKNDQLSQSAMAKKCGMDYGSYSNIENGKRNVTVFTLQRIVSVLNISFY